MTLSLTYSAPATDWESQALPIGNGRLGAMCFGGIQSERVQVNENSLWTGDETECGSYQNLGDLIIDFSHGEASAYRRSLNLATAIHSVSFAANGIRYRREYIASHPQQVLVFRFTADRPAAYNAVIRFQDAHDSPSLASANGITASGSLANGLSFLTHLRVNHRGGVVIAYGESLRIESADSFTILLAARTNYLNERSKKWRGPLPATGVAGDINAAAATSWNVLRNAHVADHDRLFSRVTLYLGQETAELPTDRRLDRYNQGNADPALEALLFQYGRYLMIACSRDALPANLQGLWNHSNNPPWRCDYHSNINVQMNYWPVETCNLSECAQPFLDYVNSLRGVRTDATADYYLNHVDAALVPRKVVRGWTVQTENNIFGAGDFKWNPPGSAWYALHFWEHYAFTRDIKFLRHTAYPVLKDVCEFWEDHLVALPDGRLVSPDGWSPEHGPVEAGVTYDQEIVHSLFENFIQASTALDIDSEYRTVVTDLCQRLAKPTIGRWGQLQEWMEDRDDPADTHRHLSHLFALHPASQISPKQTPAMAQAALVSLVARGDESTGWAMAWRLNFWARLGDGEHAHLLLRNFLTPVDVKTKMNYDRGGGVYMNLLCAHPPFQIDGNFGVTAGIAEMLLQSHEADLHLLPALPGTWADGSVKGLRARGGFVVDIEWTRGELLCATVHSGHAGRSQVRYSGGALAVEFSAGGSRTVRKGEFR